MTQSSNEHDNNNAIYAFTFWPKKAGVMFLTTRIPAQPQGEAMVVFEAIDLERRQEGGDDGVISEGQQLLFATFGGSLHFSSA